MEWDSLRRAGAILTALASLSAGDVILIEQQFRRDAGYSSGPYVPVEWYYPVYAAIQTAVGNGVIVVEAAGNGGDNLDADVYSVAGNNGHRPFLPENDSGAIIVGAGAAPGGSGVERSRLSFSNFGSTVDLQGWGELVWTTGYGSYYGSPFYNSEGPNLNYTGRAGGTSSASSIVAGACVLLQAGYKARTGSVLSPEDVKQILRATGSAQQGNTWENIGPQPDVMAAISAIVPTVSAGSFRIYNDGDSTLTVGSISLDEPADWISWSPQSPFDVPPDSFRSITVFVDCSLAPVGSTTRKLVVRSNDPDEDPYPGDITIQVNRPTPTVAQPRMEPPGGSFEDAVFVSLSCETPGATIYYSTDGSDPDPLSTPYSAPFNLTTSGRLKARGFKTGYDPSSIVSADFVITPTPTVGPPIQATLNSQGLTLSWAAALSGKFILKETDSLSPRISWNNVAATLTTNSGFVSVTLPATNAQRFFRLER